MMQMACGLKGWTFIHFWNRRGDTSRLQYRPTATGWRQSLLNRSALKRRIWQDVLIKAKNRGRLSVLIWVRCLAVKLPSKYFSDSRTSWFSMATVVFRIGTYNSFRSHMFASVGARWWVPMLTRVAVMSFTSLHETINLLFFMTCRYFIGNTCYQCSTGLRPSTAQVSIEIGFQLFGCSDSNSK